MHVVSYNLLSPELSDPATFPENDPSECDGARRLPRILARLRAQCARGAVIALQEVSVTWLGDLQCLFDAADYHYSSTLYGGWYSGYMGVGLAFPRKLFALSAFEISRISDTKKWPREDTSAAAAASSAAASASSSSAVANAVGRVWNYSAGYLRSVADPLFLLAGLIAGGAGSSSSTSGGGGGGRRRGAGGAAQQSVADMTFEQAKKRYNQAILVRLRRRSDGREVCVCTYHNPCAIHCKPIITLHAALVCQKAQAFAAGDPLVLLGDFNMTPADSGGYRLLTTGTLDESHPEYPALPARDPWRPTLVPMRSAYAAAHPEGKEPATTNKAVRLIGKWGASPNAFSGTLDYVFVSDGIAVDSVLDLPPADVLEEKASWPTDKIPSDHLLIGATLRLEGDGGGGGGGGEAKL